MFSKPHKPLPTVEPWMRFVNRSHKPRVLAFQVDVSHNITQNVESVLRECAEGLTTAANGLSSRSASSNGLQTSPVNAQSLR